MLSIENAMELDPSNSECHYIKGYSLLVRGETEEAIVSFEESVKIDPTISEGFFHLG